jgi:hypothetical protein
MAVNGTVDYSSVKEATSSSQNCVSQSVVQCLESALSFETTQRRSFTGAISIRRLRQRCRDAVEVLIQRGADIDEEDAAV